MRDLFAASPATNDYAYVIRKDVGTSDVFATMWSNDGPAGEGGGGSLTGGTPATKLHETTLLSPGDFNTIHTFWVHFNPATNTWTEYLDGSVIGTPFVETTALQNASAIFMGAKQNSTSTRFVAIDWMCLSMKFA